VEKKKQRQKRTKTMLLSYRTGWDLGKVRGKRGGRKVEKNVDNSLGGG
jgi:hypothetical protein